MYGAVKGRPEDQDARKIIAQHLVKDYILKVLVNKYVGLISLQYYQTIIAYIIDTMPIATVSNIAQ